MNTPTQKQTAIQFRSFTDDFDVRIVDEKGDTVAVMGEPGMAPSVAEREKYAALIVRAVNSHAALVEALTAAHRALVTYNSARNIGALPSKSECDEADAATIAARAALKLATEGK